MRVNINGIPSICKHLTDQSNCPEVVNVCGANSLPDVCAAKYLFLNLTYGGRADTPLIFAKSVYKAFDSSREWIFHKTMSWGHHTLHGIVEDTIRNIGG